MKVEAKNISFGLGGKAIISNINLKAEPGELVGIVGPNGSGKSTLLKNLYQFHQPDSGVVLLNEKEINSLSIKEIAQKMAVVTQESMVQFDFSVREIVEMGRSPHKKALASSTVEDEEIIRKALQKVGLEDFVNRSITTLSGGEKQRVFLARALAQRSQVLILDEPTNHLDIRHQLQLMDLIKTLKNTVLIALHDLNIAAGYCDKIYMLNKGKVVQCGTPEEVFTKKNLEEVFEVQSDIQKYPHSGKLHIIFHSNTSSVRRE